MEKPPTSDVVVSVAWMCAGICGVAVGARSISKARMIRHIGADDVFIWLGFAFFIGQCMAVHWQASNGIGQHLSNITDEMYEEELKAEYSNYLLYMPVIAFAKLSVVSVLRKCALNKKDRLLLYTFEWFLALWAISAEIARAFACQLPRPWDYLHLSCFNRQAWVVQFELINIVTELILIIIPTLSIWHLPTTLPKKTFATSFFWARIVIIPASIARIWYWIEGSTSADETYELYAFVICTVMVAALEILSACVLYVRPLFEILESGFSTSPPSSPARATQPKSPTFGPYSKGTWPFTRMSGMDDFLTGRGTGYEAKVQAAAVYDVEKGWAGSDEHIRVSKRVDVRSSASPNACQLCFNRPPSLDMVDLRIPENAMFIERDFPSPPSIQSGTFLLA